MKCKTTDRRGLPYLSTYSVLRDPCQKHHLIVKFEADRLSPCVAFATKAFLLIEKGERMCESERKPFITDRQRSVTHTCMDGYHHVLVLGRTLLPFSREWKYSVRDRELHRSPPNGL